MPIGPELFYDNIILGVELVVQLGYLEFQVAHMSADVAATCSSFRVIRHVSKALNTGVPKNGDWTLYF